jgi:hypothetical protein
MIVKTEKHKILLEEIKPIAQRLKTVDGMLDSYTTNLADATRKYLKTESIELHKKYDKLRRQIMVEMKKEAK